MFLNNSICVYFTVVFRVILNHKHNSGLFVKIKFYTSPLKKGGQIFVVFHL